MKKSIITLSLTAIATLYASADETGPESPEAGNLYQSSQNLQWEEIFHLSGHEDWEQNWFLDGRKAQVTATDAGLVFTAGPIPQDHASHAVLWTKREFKGDLLVEYEYTRLDTVEYAVNILYLHAQGKGEGIFTPDITEWSDTREIPYMRHYFNNMDLLHISYAAHLNREDETREQYIHARRYPTGDHRSFPETGLGERTHVGELIVPSVTYEITAVKLEQNLLFSVKAKKQGEETRRSFLWDTSAFPDVNGGRIGLRHMWTRSARYANFRVSTPAEL